MSMSTHVVGIKPPDDDWRKQKAVWDACEKASVPIPKKTLDFFDGENPDDAGVIVDLDMHLVQKYKDDSREGYEVDVEKLPKDIKIIRFYNSW